MCLHFYYTASELSAQSAALKLYSGFIVFMMSAVSPMFAIISLAGLYANGNSSMVLALTVDE
jgi:hypothetical protein